MTSIDDLFKKPYAPSAGSLKRKFEAPDAQTAYKSAKLTTNEPPPSNGTRDVTIEDAEDDDIEAGPARPPDDEDEDEEGRFFGDGVTQDTSEALQYLDEVDGEDAYSEEKIDSAWLRRLVANFEKKVNKNAELRARYEGQPQKFMVSEADLDAEIKTWSIVGEHPELYLELAQSESVATIVNLLAHENTDIAIGAIEIISELLDEDVEAEQDHWQALVNALLDADLLELLLSNLARLDEENESDRSGVYHSLAVMENIAGQQSTAERLGTKNVLEWLCKRISATEKTVSQNKQYAAEVLQVLLQLSENIRKRVIADIDGVDLLLQLLSTYRKRDPAKDSYEEEFAENLFDALTCLMDEAEGKQKFVEDEGVELCLIMLKEGGMSKLRALRLLDHATATHSRDGSTSILVCEKVVEAAGIKTIFSMFMKKSDNQTIEHLLGIQSNMLRSLPGESASRIRLLAKFTEKKYEKVDKLIQLRNNYSRKLEQADDDSEIQLEFCKQMIDVTLAWLIAEETAARSHIASGLKISDLKESLEDQVSSISTLDHAGADDLKEMLTTLIGFL